LVRYNKGRLMASYLGQRSTFIKWPCPWTSRANHRERGSSGLGREAYRWGNGVVQGPDTRMFIGWEGWWLAARSYQDIAKIWMIFPSFFLQTLKDKEGTVLQ
jgi:hypothetical protein